MDPLTQWALIRTICAIIAAGCSIGTLIGSIIYWTSWRKRSKRLREELAKEIELELEKKKRKEK